MRQVSFAQVAGSILLGLVALSTVMSHQEVKAQSIQTSQGRRFTGSELTTARLHQALQNQDFSSIGNYYCSVERNVAATAINSSDVLRQNAALLNAYLQITSSMYSVDVSQLYYETKYLDESQGRAVVAITGNVIIRSSDGRSASMPYRQFSAFGQDWLRLIYEGGEWKLCHNISR